MDEVTQQNAALVEEAAASAEAMQEQALALTAAVHIFKMNKAKAGTRTVAKPAAKPVPAVEHKPNPPLEKERKQFKANEEADGDWKEF